LVSRLINSAIHSFADFRVLPAQHHLALCLCIGQQCSDTGGAYTVLPTLIDSVDDAIPSTDVISFKAGRGSTYIVLIDGSVVACGLNDFGQLGDGTFDNSFGVLSFMSGSNIIDIGTGPSAKTVFYIKSDGTVSGNGLNNFGQLGVGDQIDRESPVDVIFTGGASVQYVSAADTHTVAWTENVVEEEEVSVLPIAPTGSPTQLTVGQSSTFPTSVILVP